ncbi:MAG: thrombospondin type 3 repeat-containing protein [Deltaproteobacteria bacterium]|nr:thrombospondin type 3 repeat-containing protein [Deltaproteobacteria bacterium]
MSKRRLLVPVAMLTLAPLAPPVHAAVPEALLCTETKTVNCFRDEIYILDGSTIVETESTGGEILRETIAKGCQLDLVAGKQKPICTDLNYPTAARLVAQSLLSQGFAKTQWDTFSIFGADFPAEKKVDGSRGGLGPAFFRADGVNEVDGIGLSVRKRGSYPFIGYIAGGSTTNFGNFIVPDLPPPAGLTKWPEPDPAGVLGYGEVYPECDEDAICFSGFANGFAALAAAVGQIFGPYIERGIDDRFLRAEELKGASPPADPPRRSSVAVKPSFKPSLEGAGARIWNSLYSFDASLMGGNRWRLNGDGLAETTFPSEFWLASPPFQGTSLSRFHPIELYLMGLMPSSELKPITDYSNLSSIEVQNDKLIEIYRRSFAGIAESFGQLPSVPILVKGAPSPGAPPFTESDRQLDPVRALVAAEGERSPNFAEASHVHRMLWVVVTKPNDPEKTQQQINYMLRWRRAWNAYYYMLTSYRGRMVTTADTLEDDSAYWEFGQPSDDQQTFVPTPNMAVQFPGPLPTPGSPIITTFARVVQTPGADGALVFTPHANQPPIRIKGDQNHPGAINSFAVRLRLPAGEAANSAAILQLANGPAIRVPSDPASFLIPDGKFHTYSADLSKVPEFINRDFTGFSFVPSTAQAFDVDIEFIRFAHVKVEDLGDTDISCDGTPKPDGFINTEDNCPKEYNPSQEDADGNGVGDACEDFDQDGTANLCDNCPTLTNSRQRDRDNDGKGDACDSSPGGGCFLQPESIAGGSPRGWAFGLLFAVALVARTARKRTRR